MEMENQFLLAFQETDPEFTAFFGRFACDEVIHE